MTTLYVLGNKSETMDAIERILLDKDDPIAYATKNGCRVGNAKDSQDCQWMHWAYTNGAIVRVSDLVYFQRIILVGCLARTSVDGPRQFMSPGLRVHTAGVIDVQYQDQLTALRQLRV